MISECLQILWQYQKKSKGPKNKKWHITFDTAGGGGGGGCAGDFLKAAVVFSLKKKDITLKKRWFQGNVPVEHSTMTKKKGH
jgi:hypothetical protein